MTRKAVMPAKIRENTLIPIKIASNMFLTPYNRVYSYLNMFILNIQNSWAIEVIYKNY